MVVWEQVVTGETNMGATRERESWRMGWEVEDSLVLHY